MRTHYLIFHIGNFKKTFKFWFWSVFQILYIFSYTLEKIEKELKYCYPLPMQNLTIEHILQFYEQRCLFNIKAPIAYKEYYWNFQLNNSL